MLRSIILVAVVFGSAAGAEEHLFENVAVISMVNEALAEKQFVRVRDGRIESIGTSAPEGADQAVRIAGEGRFLMPGLAEMHAHIPPSRNRQYQQDVLFLYLSQGLTTVRGMLGEPGHLELRDEVAAGELVSPRIYTAGPSLNGNSVSSPQQAVRMVRDQHAAGYDHLKLHPGLTRVQFDAIARTALELNMPFVGHVSESYGARYAIEAGMTGIDHLDGFVAALVPEDSEGANRPQGFFGAGVARYAASDRIVPFARLVAEAGTWVVPTEALIARLLGTKPTETLLSEPGMAYVSSDTRSEWAHRRTELGNADRAELDRFLKLRRRLILELARNGANLMLGSDAPQVFNVPGFSAHQELAIYVEAGLSPFEALQTGTVAVARYLDVADRRGRIAEGFDADLVLLGGNPLEDITNSRRVQGVMVAGRWYDEVMLRRGLEALRRRQN